MRGRKTGRERERSETQFVGFRNWQIYQKVDVDGVECVCVCDGAVGDGGAKGCSTCKNVL